MIVAPFSFLGNTQNTGRLVRVGQYYQGGYIAFIQGEYPNQTGLIIAPTDVTANIESWQLQTYSNISGLSQAYGSGQLNTNAILAQSSTATPAATLCNDYSNDGYTDWFLPSETELTNVRNNLALIPNSGSFVGAGVNNPPIVSLYWTSYSNTINTAISIDFGDTNTYVGNRTGVFKQIGGGTPSGARVRPCRYITPV
jgi:hypothetical protein